MKALLKALLEPTARLRAAEAAGDHTTQACAARGIPDPAVRSRLGRILRAIWQFPWLKPGSQTSSDTRQTSCRCGEHQCR